MVNRRILIFERKSSESNLEQDVEKAKALISKPNDILKLDIFSNGDEIRVVYHNDCSGIKTPYEDQIKECIQNLGYNHQSSQYL